jgi:hypothetical protein
MTTRFWTAPVAALAALLLVSASCAGADEAPTLERGLVNRAPSLIKHFKEKKYRNIGVLKFLVARHGHDYSDNAGTLNMLLARRLLVALALANDPRSPIGLVRNASAVAARTRGANHNSAGGRKKLFEPDYPLAWGKKEVKVDAFVTGTARISKDLRTLEVGLRIFDRTDKDLKPFGKTFTVHSDAGKLAEMNEGFMLRGTPDEETILKTAARIAQGKAKHPLEDADPPVRLVVLYNSKPVAIEFKGGKAYIPEPRAGKQKVLFRLVRDGSKERYGVVLKVNGENTIGRQRLPDLHCRRWILDPKAGPITITGFQVDDREAEEFVVLSRAESKAREIDYGTDVGTISITVFRERQKEETYDSDEEKARRNARVVARARLPRKDSYATLKQELLDEANEETRGIIKEGPKIASRVKKVKFTPDPIPVMTAAIIYYRPGKK